MEATQAELEGAPREGRLLPAVRGRVASRRQEEGPRGEGVRVEVRRRAAQ